MGIAEEVIVVKMVVCLAKLDFSKKILKDIGPAKFYIEKVKNEKELIEKCKGAEAVLAAKSRTGDLTKKFFESLPDLKFVSVYATGVDWIDIEAAKKANVKVSNSPGYSTEAVAEWTIYMMLRLARENTIELKGKTLGIIGLGAIGQRVAMLGKGMGMKVIAWNRSKKKPYQVSINKLLKESDFVSVHLALTKDTTKFLNAKRIGLMKKGAFLIDSAREGLVDMKAVAKALKSKKLAGAAIELDWHSKTKVLGAITTPHGAYFTKEACMRGDEVFVGNLVAWRKGRPRNLITAP